MKKIKNVKRKVVSIVATSMCLIMAVPSVAFAFTDDGTLNNPTGATGNVSGGTVTQSIDSSNYYYWTDSQGNKHYDNDIYGRVIKGDSGSWGYIWDDHDNTSPSHLLSSWNGLGSNNYGWWYCENGIVTWNHSNLEKALDCGNSNALTERTAKLMPLWYQILNDNMNLWMTFEDSKAQITDNNTVVNNENGWYYLTDGAADFYYNGFGENENGAWYIKGGAVDFDTYGLYKDDENSRGNGDDKYYYVVNGKVQEGMEEDIVKLDANDDVSSNDNGWWHIKNGMLIQTTAPYGCIAQNSNGWWYCNNYGQVDFNKNGIVYVDSSNNEVASGSSSAVASYTVSSGKVDK